MGAHLHIWHHKGDIQVSLLIFIISYWVIFIITSDLSDVVSPASGLRFLTLCVVCVLISDLRITDVSVFVCWTVSVIDEATVGREPAATAHVSLLIWTPTHSPPGSTLQFQLCIVVPPEKSFHISTVCLVVVHHQERMYRCGVWVCRYVLWWLGWSWHRKSVSYYYLCSGYLSLNLTCADIEQRVVWALTVWITAANFWRTRLHSMETYDSGVSLKILVRLEVRILSDTPYRSLRIDLLWEQGEEGARWLCGRRSPSWF